MLFSNLSLCSPAQQPHALPPWLLPLFVKCPSMPLICPLPSSAWAAPCSHQQPAQQCHIFQQQPAQYCHTYCTAYLTPAASSRMREKAVVEDHLHQNHW